MFKNTASQKLTVFAFDSTTNLPKTGDAANITAYVSKDDGTVTVLADTSATEQDATNAKGYYIFDLAQAETNGDKLLFSAKSSTSNIVVIAQPAVVYTIAGDAFVRLGAPVGASTAADIANVLAAASNIAVTGAALNKTVTSISITTGTETGTVANTTQLDATYDAVADVAGTVDFYYQFDLSAITNAAAAGVEWTGYVAGVVNTISVYAYNWGSTTFEKVGSIVGIAGTTNSSQSFELTNSHTGTGGNLGLVRLRFQATGLTSSSTKTDRILLGYVVTPPTVVAIATGIAGVQMDLVNAPNATAVTAIQSGLATSAALATAQTAITATKAKTDHLPSADAGTANGLLILGNNMGQLVIVPTGAGAPIVLLASTGNSHGIQIISHGTGVALDLEAEVGGASSGTLGATTIAGNLATSSALVTAQTAITAIGAKTTNLPASPAAVGSQMDLINTPNATAVTAIQSGLATTTTTNAIKAKTDNLPASPADESLIIAATNALATSIAALPNATAIANALLDLANGVETGWTLRQVCRLVAAVIAGKASNNGATFRDLNDTKNRIVATADSSGNRTAITTDVT